MTADEIRNVRLSLNLTQVQFASLLGVHSLTVSKWERGVIEPPKYHEALIHSFRTAAQRQPGVGDVVAASLIGAGLGVALFELLRAAFQDVRR